MEKFPRAGTARPERRKAWRAGMPGTPQPVFIIHSFPVVVGSFSLCISPLPSPRPEPRALRVVAAPCPSEDPVPRAALVLQDAISSWVTMSFIGRRGEVASLLLRLYYHISASVCICCLRRLL